MAETRSATLVKTPRRSRFECEVWAEYVHGRALELASDADLELLANYFASRYRGGARDVLFADTSWHEKLQTYLWLLELWLLELWLLERASALTAHRIQLLTRHAEDLKPEAVLEGFDDVDPVAKIFVIAKDGSKAIDVESIQADQLLGTAIAKAGIDWPELSVDERFDDFR